MLWELSQPFGLCLKAINRAACLHTESIGGTRNWCWIKVCVFDQLYRLGGIGHAALSFSARPCREAPGGEVERFGRLGGPRRVGERSFSTPGGASPERRLGGSSGERESAVVGCGLVLSVAALWGKGAPVSGGKAPRCSGVEKIGQRSRSLKLVLAHEASSKNTAAAEV